MHGCRPLKHQPAIHFGASGDHALATLDADGHRQLVKPARCPSTFWEGTMALSSYENQETCNLIHVDEDAVFRRTPVAEALGMDRDRAGACSAKDGHILYLVVSDGEVKKIRCENCPAEWIDEGF